MTTKERTHDYKRAFYLARFVEHHFEDERIFKAASMFLDEKKKLLGGNCQSKCGASNQYKAILRMFFSEIQIEEITKQQVFDKLNEYSGPWNIRLHFMWEFIFYLKDLGKLNREWEQLEHLRERLCTNPSGKFSKTVLSVPDSSRFHLLQFGINTKLYYLDSGSDVIRDLMIDFLSKWNRIPDDKDYIFAFLFESSGICPTSLEDVDYAMFCRQMDILNENAGCEKYLVQLIDFYRFIYTNIFSNCSPFIFSFSSKYFAILCSISKFSVNICIAILYAPSIITLTSSSICAATVSE